MPVENRRISLETSRSPWHVFPVLIAVLLSTGCPDGSVLPLCDDPFPALVVHSVDGAGVRIEPDKVEVFQDGELEETLQCGAFECATWNLTTGEYRVVGTWRGEVLEEVVSVENSFACDHDVAEVEFAFEAVS